MRGGGEDVAGGAVVAFEPDNLGAGEVVLEAQDVVDLRPPPAIDRLVVVADAADVFGGRLRRGRHSGMRDLLPRPACGERVGVRGSLQELSRWRVPLTRIASQHSHGIVMASFFKNVG